MSQESESNVHDDLPGIKRFGRLPWGDRIFVDGPGRTGFAK